MSRAPIVPVFPAGAPISVLVDYDGTVSRQDVGTVLLAEHALVDRAVVAAKDADYDAGRSGSRELMQWDMEVLPRDGALLRAAAAEIPQDETFVSFVAAVREAGAAMEIVSDGLGFYVASKLAQLDPGIVDLPIATNENDVDRSGRMTFPYGHPACFVCGTCKRERVRAHEAGRARGVFIGDGQSDRYAAHHADIVFAKDALLAWGRATGRDFRANGIASPRSKPGSSRRSPTAGYPRRRLTCPPGGRRTGRFAPTSSAVRRPGSQDGWSRGRSTAERPIAHAEAVMRVGGGSASLPGTPSRSPAGRRRTRAPRPGPRGRSPAPNGRSSPRPAIRARCMSCSTSAVAGRTTPASRARSRAFLRSLRWSRIRKPGSKRPPRMLSRRISRTFVAARPPWRTSAIRAGSTPALAPSTSASETASMTTATTTWLQTFATWPAPDGPTWTIVLPRACEDGQALARSRLPTRRP